MTNRRHVLLIAVVVFATVAAPANALAPGPWKLLAHGKQSGRAPRLLVSGRWTYQEEYGPASGIVEKYPIPKRMAFVITETPRQPVHVDWSALCYPNGERARPSQGSAHATGTITIYPNLYAKRVECDPYVVAKLASPGTVAIRIYAY